MVETIKPDKIRAAVCRAGREHLYVLREEARSAKGENEAFQIVERIIRIKYSVGMKDLDTGTVELICKHHHGRRMLYSSGVDLPIKQKFSLLADPKNYLLGTVNWVYSSSGIGVHKRNVSRKSAPMGYDLNF